MLFRSSSPPNYQKKSLSRPLCLSLPSFFSVFLSLLSSMPSFFSLLLASHPSQRKSSPSSLASSPPSPQTSPVSHHPLHCSLMREDVIFHPPLWPWSRLSPDVSCCSFVSKKKPPTPQENGKNLTLPSGPKTKEKNYLFFFKGSTNMSFFGRIHECKEHEHQIEKKV